MDDQQHALAGLLRTIPIVEASEGRAGGSTEPGDDAPAAWLWAAVLLLALNPARAAFAVPRAGRSPRDVVGVAAAGGAIGGLAVCAAAAAGSAAARRARRQRPLVPHRGRDRRRARRRRRPVPTATRARARAARPARRARPGRDSRAVARPALLVVALGAGADQGVLVSAAAMAAGIALPGRTGGRGAQPRAAEAGSSAGRAGCWRSRSSPAESILALDGIMDV